MTAVSTLSIDKTAVAFANDGNTFRQNFARYAGIANAAGGSAGAAVTTTLEFSDELPDTDYIALVIASQACCASFANKAVGSVDIVLTPKNAADTLSAGTFDVLLLWGSGYSPS